MIHRGTRLGKGHGSRNVHGCHRGAEEQIKNRDAVRQAAVRIETDTNETKIGK